MPVNTDYLRLLGDRVLHKLIDELQIPTDILKRQQDRSPATQPIHTVTALIPPRQPFRSCDMTSEKATSVHAPPGDDLLSQVIDIIEQGIDPEHYLAARAAGVSHDQFVDALTLGVDLSTYVKALRAGVAHADVMTTPVECALNPNIYIKARLAGATDRQVRQISRLAKHQASRDSMLASYARSRGAGATHRQTATAASVGINLYDYYQGYQERISHEDMINANAVDIQIFGYTLARAIGATHQEILDAHSHQIPMSVYLESRTAGANHAQTLSQLLMPALGPG